MEEMMEEYVTFHVTAKDGSDYECIMDGDDFTVQQIKKEFDYRRIANAYMAMDA